MAPCASLYALHYLYFRPENRTDKMVIDDGNNADDDDRDNVDDDHDDDGDDHDDNGDDYDDDGDYHDDDGLLTLVLSSFLPSSPITASQSPIGWTSTFTSNKLSFSKHQHSLYITILKT